ncbi:angiogenic factor with G patch and FHA domains 1 isoform X2 [Lycorma delicatula]|uniref:angiogenic factor with G patch and FHA domains 1 isoform X2 n=1 Tax=Lycorma delicatula TaxID=130591 RepID=UPI003F51956E
MCDVEKEIYFSCAEDSETFKQDISNSFETDLKDLPEVLGYVQRLQDCIVRQRRIIIKLHEKLRNQVTKDNDNKVLQKSFSDGFTQTYEEDFLKESQDFSNEAAGGGSIVDQVKEIAESAVRQTGFVYESSSGMYYDYNTGYYYNAELGLYYDGNSGTYFTFDEETKTFNYHSSLVKSVEDASSKRKSVENNENMVNDILAGVSRLSINDSLRKRAIELADAWPPCMRVVVQETGLDNLNVGTLFIVTYNGGTLGREGNHSVTIPDITISKHHASFKFSEEKKHYTVVDLGSRNGTFLNGNRLSVALQESPPHPIEHGSILRVGSTHLLCHIHDGHQTCNQCEPGCMLPVKPDKGEALNESRQVRHRSELRRLRRKFGLEGPGSGLRITNNSANYQDRAEVRRKTVGSSDSSEKTEVASVYQPIRSDNKGFKMMSKMGWTEGQALGKDSSAENAILEPITVEQHAGKAGLGCSEGSVSTEELSSSTQRKNTIWKKTLKRYNDLS